MYVYRQLDELKSVPYEQWTIEELAYHHDTMSRFNAYLNEEGRTILGKVDAEIRSRGGLPLYDGDYDHPSNVHYD